MNKAVFRTFLVINILNFFECVHSDDVKQSIDGLSRIFDDKVSDLFMLGDPHGGLPDDVTSLVKYCTDFVTSGLYGIAHLTARYPLKFLMKAITATSVIGFIKTNAQYCVNPLTMTDFTTRARLVNPHNERLSEIRDEWKKRLVYAVDKVEQNEKQKYACCAFHEYKRKTIEEVPEAADFIRMMFRGYFKMSEIVFCKSYQEDSGDCADTQFADEEPTRAIGRSWILHVIELFAQFM